LTIAAGLRKAAVIYISADSFISPRAARWRIGASSRELTACQRVVSREPRRRRCKTGLFMP